MPRAETLLIPCHVKMVRRGRPIENCFFIGNVISFVTHCFPFSWRIAKGKSRLNFEYSDRNNLSSLICSLYRHITVHYDTLVSFRGLVPFEVRVSTLPQANIHSPFSHAQRLGLISRHVKIFRHGRLNIGCQSMGLMGGFHTRQNMKAGGKLLKNQLVFKSCSSFPKI